MLTMLETGISTKLEIGTKEDAVAHSPRTANIPAEEKTRKSVIIYNDTTVVSTMECQGGALHS